MTERPQASGHSSRTGRRRRTPAALVSRIVVAGLSASGMFGLVAAMGAAARPDGPTLTPIVVAPAPAGQAALAGQAAPAPVGQAAPAPVVTDAPPEPARPAPAPVAKHTSGRTKRS